MASVRKTLISLFGILRSQAEAQRDLSLQVQAIYDYLIERDSTGFAKAFEKHEGAGRADPAIVGASALTQELIDGVVESLKGGEPLEL